MWVKGEYFDDFDAAAQAARGTLDRANQPHLFDRLDWLRATWAHCPPGERPLIVRAVSERAQAWLFLARRESGGLVALASWYTLAFRPIFAGDPDEATKLRLLTAIAARLRGSKLPSIVLSPVPAEDNSADLIKRAFARRGWIALGSPATVNWIAEPGAGFASWWAERPGEVRSTVSRKGKKAAVDIAIHDRFDGEAWAAYEAVYAESWKGEEGAPNFLRWMAETEGAAGTLRLGIARIEGRPVAAQLWTVENGTAIIHKLAYAEDASEHSPGTLLSAAMFERAIDTDRATLIDYGTGNDGYKAAWMERARPLERVELYNPRTLNGLGGAARAQAARLVRRRPVA